MNDPFSKCHPAVNFLFFVGAIAFAAFFQHPAYLAAGIGCGCIYYLQLNGRKGTKFLLAMLPLFLFLTVINPLFNTRGDTLLFLLFGRPYTLEALIYGAVVAGIFVDMLLWFGCYNKVLTSDKFTSLFGSLIPAISLLLVMVFRMVPNLMRKAAQISGARKSVGKGLGETAGNKEKLRSGAAVLDALTTWALEGSVVTGDSMRARGYGTAKRSSFMIYRIGSLDITLLVLLPVLAGIVILFACLGSTAAEFTPQLSIIPVTARNLWGLLAYTIYLLIPPILHGKEALQWHIMRSKI